MDDQVSFLTVFLSRILFLRNPKRSEASEAISRLLVEPYLFLHLFEKNLKMILRANGKRSNIM